ncbi:MFS transporter [Jatrophihabitans sp.]|uniref:MFS transporter n=1 Tax=Jatrophihabitans sp. TaxID=1932789 RepID=UPI002C5B58B4|nr:MFS transporter [Jatrophihabitans sp.]
MTVHDTVAPAVEHGGPTDTGPAPRARTSAASAATTLVAVAIASVMVPFAVTAPAVALTRMAQDLNASPGGIQWVLNGYNVAFASSLLAAGTVADRFGRRRVLLSGTALYALMALISGLAGSIGVVDIARAIQGIGSAGILTGGAATLAATFSGPARAKAFGVLGTAFGAGLALGPLLAGVLVDALSWRAVFLLTVLLAAAVLTLGSRILPSRDDNAGKLDIGGLLCFTASLLLLTLGLVEGPISGWASAPTVASLIGAAVFMAGFVAVENRTGSPAFDLSLFKRPVFVAVMSQPFTIVFGFVILVVFLPPYFQGVNGSSAAAAGALLLPLMLPVLVVPTLSGQLAARVGLRPVLVVSSALIGAGALGLLVLQPHQPLVEVAIPLLVFGLGVGGAFGVMDGAAVSVVPVEQSGAAAGMFNTIRITGESIATAGAAALLSSLTLSSLLGTGDIEGDRARSLAVESTQGRGADSVDSMGLGAAGAGLKHTIETGLTSAMHITFVVVAVLAFTGSVVTAWALKNRQLES